MKMTKLQIVIIFLTLVFVSLACGFSASTANIKDAYMARDTDGVDKTAVFTQADEFFCIVQLANAPDDTTLKAVWIAVDAQDTDPNYLIDEYSLTTGDAEVPFSLSNDLLWPLGTYKVELYLNEKLDRTLDFEVK